MMNVKDYVKLLTNERQEENVFAVLCLVEDDIYLTRWYGSYTACVDLILDLIIIDELVGLDSHYDYYICEI